MQWGKPFWHWQWFWSKMILSLASLFSFNKQYVAHLPATTFPEDTWCMSWGRIWQITKTFGKFFSSGNSWVARLSKTDRMSSIIQSWQWKLEKSDLIPQRWQKWCSLPGSWGYAGPHFHNFWVNFWGVESGARGNSVASEKKALNETTAGKTLRKTSISRFLAFQKPRHPVVSGVTRSDFEAKQMGNNISTTWYSNSW